MTRTIFGRRQVVLRQRARQDAWRRALEEELDLRTLGPEARIEALRERPAEERFDVVSMGAGARLRDPRD